MQDDGRPWWYVPRQARALSGPVAAVLLAMGASDLVRAGATFWVGWLLVAVGAGLGLVVLAGQRHDDRSSGRGVRRTALLALGYLLVAAFAVGTNVLLAAELGP